MTRKYFPTTLLAAALLQASLAHGLGLGDITLRSALDEPLSAEIRLRGVRELDESQIMVRLASQADFERAGVERLFFLTDMRFEVELDGDNGRLRVTTERPIREPYLDFVVEVRWPTGRVLREYTVLLDLPMYRPEPAPRVEAPAARAPVRSAPSAPAARGTWEGDTYTVARNDTLWSIADRSRPAGVSIQQMMIAIHRDNPDAFIRGNINLLKAGQVLRMPAGADIAGLSQAEAASTVSEHDRSWRGDTAPGTAPAPPEAPAPREPVAPQAPDEDAYLRLAGDTESAAAGSAAGGTADAAGASQGGAVEEQLALAQESLSAAERSNAELQARVAALEEQVKDFERLVELRNDSAAGAAQSAQAAADTPAAAVAEPAPAPAAPPGLLDRLLGNTLVLAGAAGVLVLGALAFLFARRRGAYVPLPEPTQRGPLGRTVERREPEAGDQGEPEPQQPAEERALFGAPARARADDQAGGDPLSEADIYIAYGKTATAIEVLAKALAEDPRRSDVRLKLMDIHAEQGDEAAFMAEYDRLDALGDTQALSEARELIADTDRAHWLRALDAPEPGAGEPPQAPAPAPLAREPLPAPEPAPAPPAAEPAPQAVDEAPAFATAEVEADSLVFEEADLDLEPEPDARVADEAEEELDLDLEIGELELGTDEVSPQEVVPEPIAAPASEPRPAEDELDLVGSNNETETKLELARAYIDMGDMDGARDILEEVASEGNAEQRATASEMLESMRG